MAATALTASYVLYGFDTAGTLAEETHDPRKKAPRAILQALLAAGFAGLLVLLFALMAGAGFGNARIWVITRRTTHVGEFSAG
jgi:amino acid transporter